MLLCPLILVGTLYEAGIINTPTAYSVHGTACSSKSHSVRTWTPVWLPLKSIPRATPHKFLGKVLMQLSPTTWQRFCSLIKCANVELFLSSNVSWVWPLDERESWGTIPILNARGVLAIEMAEIYFYDSEARGKKPSPKVWIFYWIAVI